MTEENNKQKELEDKQNISDLHKGNDITTLNIYLNERIFRLNTLERDVERIRENIGEHDDDMLKITRTLQKQIDEKDEVIQKYEKRIIELIESEAGKKKNIEQKFDAEKSEVQRKQEQEEEHQRWQEQQLQAKQLQLLEFRNRQMIAKEERKNKEVRYKTLLRKLTEVEREGEEDIKRQDTRMKATYAQFLTDFKFNAQEKAEKNISEIERNIQIQNQRLEDEAAIQDEEIAYLEQKNIEVEQQNKEFAAELNDRGQTVEEHARHQFEKSKKIKLLKTKIDLLEKSLSQIVADFEKERELLKFQNEQTIREQAQEGRNLTEQVRLKNTELTNMRALCQMVLDQRSDIEQFFLEALEQVKEEKRRKLQEEQDIKQSQQLPEFLPLIEPGSKFSKKNFEQQNQMSQQQANKVTVELSDLNWVERETVLRLLFSKMNTGEAAQNWREPGEPSRTGSKAYTENDQGRYSENTSEQQRLNRAFRESEHESSSRGTGRQGVNLFT